MSFCAFGYLRTCEACTGNWRYGTNRTTLFKSQTTVCHAEPSSDDSSECLTVRFRLSTSEGITPCGRFELDLNARPSPRREDAYIS